MKTALAWVAWPLPIIAAIGVTHLQRTIPTLLVLLLTAATCSLFARVEGDVGVFTRPFFFVIVAAAVWLVAPTRWSLAAVIPIVMFGAWWWALLASRIPYEARPVVEEPEEEPEPEATPKARALHRTDSYDEGALSVGFTTAEDEPGQRVRTVKPVVAYRSLTLPEDDDEDFDAVSEVKRVWPQGGREGPMAAVHLSCLAGLVGLDERELRAHLDGAGVEAKVVTARRVGAEKGEGATGKIGYRWEWIRDLEPAE